MPRLLLNFNKATRPLLLLPAGLVYFALYYGLFRFVIVRLDLKTPGREEGAVAAESATDSDSLSQRALAYIIALGGVANIVALDACTTRLRLAVADQSAVDAEELKHLGVRGLVKPSANVLQVVVGTHADQVAGEIKAALRASGNVAAAPTAGATSFAAKPVPAPPTNTPPAAAPATSVAATSAVAIPTPTLTSLLAALGGRANVRSVETASSRLRINIVDASIVDEPAITSLGLRGVAVAAPNWVHVIIGPGASATGESLRQLLA